MQTFLPVMEASLKPTFRITRSYFCIKSFAFERLFEGLGTEKTHRDPYLVSKGTFSVMEYFV
jgi:hypothetical protein